MKWVAISGSWRTTNAKVAADVRQAVAEVLNRGDGIITGGALGVDYIATEEALKHNPAADRIRVIIPASLEVYAAHYKMRADEGVITSMQAESLIALLAVIKGRRSGSLIEMDHAFLDETAYYERNTRVLDGADALLAFQVNGSLGVQDTIDKARRARLAVGVKQYKIVT